MSEANYKYSETTGKIIKAFYNVYNQLGFGFLEKVYENAMKFELKKMNVPCEAQKQIKVFYDTEEVGVYFADLMVEDCVIVELKAAEALCEEHEAQLVNYLRATEFEVGLLLNFGKTPQIKKKIFSAEFKTHNKS